MDQTTNKHPQEKTHGANVTCDEPYTTSIVLSLENRKDPSEFLKAALQDSGGTYGVKSLHALYSGILKARISAAFDVHIPAVPPALILPPRRE